MSKYKINMNDIERTGGIERLEKDGFSRVEIMDAFHKQTDQNNFGHKTRTDQRNLIQNLFNRSKSE